MIATFSSQDNAASACLRCALLFEVSESSDGLLVRENARTGALTGGLVTESFIFVDGIGTFCIILGFGGPLDCTGAGAGFGFGVGMVDIERAAAAFFWQLRQPPEPETLKVRLLLGNGASRVICFFNAGRRVPREERATGSGAVPRTI